MLEIIADCRWLVYLLGSYQPASRQFGEAVTEAVRQAQYGSGGTLVLPDFEPPPLPPAEPGSTPALPAVVARAEGVLNRLFDIIQEIKENNACTDAMCADLGIIGATETAPDLETLRPEITALRSGSTVKIGWGWGGYAKFLDACEIMVDRATGSWAPLVTDTTPNYTDSAPQPPAQAIWKYKAIYRIDDQQAGQWSLEVSVVVGG